MRFDQPFVLPQGSLCSSLVSFLVLFLDAVRAGSAFGTTPCFLLSEPWWTPVFCPQGPGCLWCRPALRWCSCGTWDQVKASGEQPSRTCPLWLGAAFTPGPGPIGDDHQICLALLAWALRDCTDVSEDTSTLGSITLPLRSCWGFCSLTPPIHCRLQTV